MSDFEMFEGEVNHVVAEDDPAADFLAREQNQLAGLEDDSLGLDSANPELTNDIMTADSNDEVNLHSSTEHLNGPSNNEPFPAAPKPVQREEPSKIKKWREEQQIMLEKKDAEEEVKKVELQESAKKELEDWYVRYKEQIEKSKLNNRNAEKEWVAERDAESPGLEWERIARLCEFNPKSSRGTKDTSRMRSIILQLKQNPVTPRKASS